jgi:hypothetical protein
MSPTRLGSVSGAMVVAVGVAYVAALGVGFAKYGLSEPITDPLLAIMEVLTLASAIPLVSLVLAILLVAPKARRPQGILALCFIVMFATATSAVHLALLTAGRQLGTEGLVWPSPAYAVELLAWDLFLGVALILCASALDPQQASPALRRGVQVTGFLCVVGIIGPVLGNMRLQLVGVFGYGVALPVVALGLTRWFRGLSRAGVA